ncbi:hypothetical protein BJX68DRAFT_265620 [Aspergillus pseudodeflectus]|uniref:DNA2/NAM7 helicase helicase domain-containing protein n=1 Tax=Aspergillus pseudodeflectus TaxID=176178 RepID=A0ABR4KKD8_9EURO
MAEVRAYYRQNKLLNLLVIGPYFDQGLGNWLGSIEEDRDKNRLNAWYPKHPDRHCLQVGEYAKPEECPQVVDRSTKNSFADFDEYTTVLGYASIYEQEHRDRLVPGVSQFLRDMPDDDMKNFRTSLRTLRDDALVRSDVVVCTAFATSMTALRENVTPHAIIVDEAARFTEPELWPVLAWYQPKGSF